MLARALIIVPCLLAVGCGAQGDGANPQEAEAPAVGNIVLGRTPVAMDLAKVPADAALVSFLEDGRLRVRTLKGTSLVMPVAPVGEATPEWSLTEADAAALGGADGLYRASEGLVWRFAEAKVSAYTRSSQTSAWRTYEAAVPGTWSPLAVETAGVIAFVEGLVQVAWMSEGKLKSKEFTWPKGAARPDAAGFLGGREILWVHGGGAIYSINVSTGVWKGEGFEAPRADWGSLRSMAFLPARKGSYSLSAPRYFAALGAKGLFLLSPVRGAN